MDYRWRYQDADGADVPGPDERFDDQDAAEAWFSGAWSQLYGAGVRQVTLVCGADPVYGPMSLEAAE